MAIGGPGKLQFLKPPIISDQALINPPSAVCSFVSNANAPQIANYALVIGVGFFCASALNPQGIAASAQYTYGTHAVETHNAETYKTQIWESVLPSQKNKLGVYVNVSQQTYTDWPGQINASVRIGQTPPIIPFVSVPPQTDPSQLAPQLWKSVPTPPALTGFLGTVIAAAPQSVELTQQPSIWRSVNLPQGISSSSQYTYGLHAVAFYDAETFKTKIWPAVTAAAPVTGVLGSYLSASPQTVDLTQQPAILRSASAPPVAPTSVASYVSSAQQPIDLTQQPTIWSSVAAPSVAASPITRYVTAGPQLVDLTQQPSIWAPPNEFVATLTTVYFAAQEDPTQPQPQIWSSISVTVLSTGRVPPYTSGAPQQVDLTQQGRFTPIAAPPIITGPTVWPNAAVPPQFDITVNGTQVWTPSTFSQGSLTQTMTQPSGGYWPAYDSYAYKRRKRDEELKLLAQEAEQAQQTELEAELARRLHAELARQAELDDLQRLRELVASNAELTYASERVQTALAKAKVEQTFSRLQALQRELIRAQIEEEMALLILLAMSD